jgi:hypothetical protein
MPAKMSASFVRVDGGDELGYVELEADGEPPGTVVRNEVTYAFERIADGPLAVYVERRPV